MLDPEEPVGVFHQGDELDLAQRQAAFGFQFIDDGFDRLDVFGAVHLGQHQRGHTGDDGGFQIAHQQAPGAVHTHQHIGAVAVHLRDRVGDQGARTLLLGRRDRVLQIQDDGVGAAVGAGLDEFLGRDRHEHQGSPGWQVITHGQASLITPSATIAAMRAGS